MPIIIAGKKIRSVLVLDDSKEARESMSFALTEAGTEPLMEEGPIESARAFTMSLRERTDAVLSDYRLTPFNYSPVQGDVLVAHCIKMRMPALLCTAYVDIDIQINRRLMRFIPVILRTTSPEPDEIRDAFSKCILEISGKISPPRKPWRTLVRIDEVDEDRAYCQVIVPAREADQKIRLSLDSIPTSIRRFFKDGARFHARVNIGAETPQDLFFDKWEPY